MKTVKIIYYFIAILVLIIVGMDFLQNCSYEELFIGAMAIAFLVVIFFPFGMIIWEEYNEKNKNK